MRLRDTLPRTVTRQRYALTMDCQGCGKPLPVLARANRHYHGDACRSLAARRRRKERVDRQFGASAGDVELLAAVERATSEPRLLANVAKAAQTNWRASVWLLQVLHGYGERARDDVPASPDADDPFVEVDMLAARRRAALARS
jgi:hypothetical protein